MTQTSGLNKNGLIRYVVASTHACSLITQRYRKHKTLIAVLFVFKQRFFCFSSQNRQIVFQKNAAEDRRTETT